MGGAGRQSDAGVHRSAGALVDQGAVPEYFHCLDGAGEAGSHIRGHLYRGGDGAVIVGGSNGHSPAAGERGGQIVGGMPMPKEGDGASGEDQEDAEDDILDEAALGVRGNSERIHRANTHKYTSDFFKKKAGFYLDVLLWKG